MTLSYLDDIRRRAGILAERERLDENASKRYFQMFQGLIPHLESMDITLGVLRQKLDAQEIMEQITKYRHYFKREDRVVWALRWFRYMLAVTVWSEYGERKINPQQYPDRNPQAYQQFLRLFEKIKADVVKRAGTSNDDVLIVSARQLNTQRLFNEFEHFFSLELPSIEAYQFDGQLPSQIIDRFEEIEQEWRENLERELDPTDDGYDGQAEKIIEFPDGFAWWNLGVAYCSKEADAMGHCGNSPRAHTDDRILSLRQRITRGDHVADVPYLTFILNGDGQLTEMKGRGNEKPAKRYHPYIVELLKQNFIEGIKGGGYLPENNFSLNDLDGDVRAELLKVNPDLEPITDKIRRLGPDPKLIDKLYDYANQHEMAPDEFTVRRASKDSDKIEIVLKSWKNFEDFAGDYDWEPLNKLESYLQKAEDGWSEDAADSLKIDPDDMFEFLERLPTEYQDKIINDLGVSDRNRYQTLKRAADHINRSSYYDLIAASFLEAIAPPSPQTDKEIIDYAHTLIGLMDFVYWYGSLEWEGEFSFDKPLEFTTDLDSFMNIVDTAAEGDEDLDGEDAYMAYKIKHGDGGYDSGWTYVDMNNTEERYREISHGYGDPGEKEILAKFENLTGDFTDTIHVTNFDMPKALDAFERRIKYNESQDDAELDELRRRAGIRL